MINNLNLCCIAVGFVDILHSSPKIYNHQKFHTTFAIRLLDHVVNQKIIS